MNLIFGFQTMRLESEQLTLKLSQLDLQMIELYTSQNALTYSEMTWSNQLKMRQLQIQVEIMQSKELAAARRQLLGLGVGLVFSTYMGISAMTKEAKALGALMTAVQAATMAYIALGTAKMFANPLLSPRHAAAAAAAIGIGAGLAVMATPLKEPDMPEMPEMDFNYPQFTDVGQFQRGTRFVPETQVAIVHKGERIVPEGQGTASAGDVVSIDAGSWNEFVDRLWKEFGIRVRRERGRYVI